MLVAAGSAVPVVEWDDVMVAEMPKTLVLRLEVTLGVGVLRADDVLLTPMGTGEANANKLGPVQQSICWKIDTEVL